MIFMEENKMYFVACCGGEGVMAEQDYCQYIISKCATKGCSHVTNGVFRTTNELLDSYEHSQSFVGSVKTRNKRIIDLAAGVIDGRIHELEALDADAQRVLSRCQKKIKKVSTYDELFSVLSDFLWVMASCKEAKKQRISLIDDSIKERKQITAWITEWEEETNNARYDLECMDEAEHLPIRKQIFQGLINNPDVAKYTNREYISYEDFKQRIHDCKIFIQERQQLYYAFIATVVYREDLRRRYR